MTTTNKSHKARTLAKKIATYMIADEVFENDHRWVKDEGYFSEADKERLNTLIPEIIAVFDKADGSDWNNVLNGLKALSPVFHFGFKAQDVAIEMLTRYGYSFN